MIKMKLADLNIPDITPWEFSELDYKNQIETFLSIRQHEYDFPLSPRNKCGEYQGVEDRIDLSPRFHTAIPRTVRLPLPLFFVWFCTARRPLFRESQEYDRDRGHGRIHLHRLSFYRLFEHRLLGNGFFAA